MEALFPERDELLPTSIHTEQLTLFETNEIRVAAEKIKTGKAPGPDRIPPDVVKEMIRTVPQLVTEALNGMLNEQKFPTQWKLAKLILIHKAGKPFDSPSGYRPLCLVDAMAKLYEHLIKTRLEHEIHENEGLSCNQYGFRKGKSTMDAIETVIAKAKNIK